MYFFPCKELTDSFFLMENKTDLYSYVISINSAFKRFSSVVRQRPDHVGRANVTSTQIARPSAYATGPLLDQAPDIHSNASPHKGHIDV
jgi:hypothetical protein